MTCHVEATQFSGDVWRGGLGADRSPESDRCRRADAGELDVFREVGLTGVFFGQSLVGSKMPNLTYMLGFENKEDQEAAWNHFGTSPGWLKLKAMPEYADKRILCGITNLLLKPAEYSQV